MSRRTQVDQRIPTNHGDFAGNKWLNTSTVKTISQQSFTTFWWFFIELLMSRIVEPPKYLWILVEGFFFNHMPTLQLTLEITMYMDLIWCISQWRISWMLFFCKASVFASCQVANVLEHRRLLWWAQMPHYTSTRTRFPLSSTAPGKRTCAQLGQHTKFWLKNIFSYYVLKIDFITHTKQLSCFETRYYSSQLLFFCLCGPRESGCRQSRHDSGAKELPRAVLPAWLRSWTATTWPVTKPPRKT